MPTTEQSTAANNHTPSKLPFECFRCEKEPLENFSIYEPLGDHIIAWPEISLVHCHFGVSSHEVQTNIGEAQFIYEWFIEVTKQNPDVEFFVINDLTSKDDSESFEKEANQYYSKLRNHPQAVGGSTYGSTFGIKMLVKLLNMTTKKIIKMRNTLEDCEADYEHWYSGKASSF